MSKAQLSKFVQKMAYGVVKEHVPSSFTPNNGDPTCLVLPIINSFEAQLKSSGIMVDSFGYGIVENSNPSDFDVDSETKRYRYTYKIPTKTPKGKENNLVLTFNITTYWYKDVSFGRNEINAVIDVMSEVAYNRIG